LDIKNDRIRILERENAELKAKLRAVNQRQFKSNKKSEEENINCAAAPMKSKKRGAPVGHPGWTRPRPDRVDRMVNVPAPEICPHCKSDNLAPIEKSTEHFQEDIVIQPRTAITRYLHGQAFCARCNRSVAQAGKGEILNAAIGLVAKSAGIYLRYRMGLSYRKTTELFRELFGLIFAPASALGFDRKADLKPRALFTALCKLQEDRASIPGNFYKPS